MRLFIALRFTEEFKIALDKLAKTLRANSSGGNFTRLENYHLTLAFIGETDRCRDLKKLINSVEYDRFDISLERSGHFGDIQWVGLKRSPELEGLASDISDRLTASGIDFDKKQFKPHITLARKCVPHSGFRLDVPDVSMTCASVSLMDSSRINGELTYTEIFKKDLK